MQIKVMENILERNDKIAVTVHDLLTSKGIFVVNLLGSPGCGKTTILEHTIKALKNDVKLAVIEGDLFTAKDAERIEKQGVQVLQINTSGGCHLDANMVYEALNYLDINELELLIIENVGNLVCPAEFNIGEDIKITVLSVTEGDDKPLKYPLVFKESSAVIINKNDLLEYTTFDKITAINDIKSINPRIDIFNVSCTTGNGLDLWYKWLKEQIITKQNRRNCNVKAQKTTAGN